MQEISLYIYHLKTKYIHQEKRRQDHSIVPVTLAPHSIPYRPHNFQQRK